MPFARPRVGKKHEHPVDAFRFEIDFEYFHRVVMHQAQVAQLVFDNALQGAADTGFIDVDAEKVRPRLLARHLQQGVAGAETDLDRQWLIDAENLAHIQRFRFKFDDKF